MFSRLPSIIIFALTANTAFAQLTPGFGNTSNLVPPSPDAAALANISDIPVSNYTGLPSINIPIAQAKSYDINIPVSISYLAGGVQVGSTSSSVGMNWNLNAGGSITRSMRGSADEYCASFWGTRCDTDLVNNPSLFVDDDINGNAYNYNHSINKAASGRSDLQPDIYYVNAPGLSFQFMIGTDGKYYTFPIQNVKIQPLLNGQIEVTSAEGMVYDFGPSYGNGAVDITEGRKVPPIHSPNYNYPIIVPSYPNYISTWHLAEIHNSAGISQASFQYLNQDSTYYLGSMSHTLVGNLSSNSDANYPTDPPGYEFYNYPIKDTVRLMNVSSISKIVTPTTNINFYYNTLRRDLPKNKLLDSIVTYSQSNVKINSFKFYHSYFPVQNDIHYLFFPNLDNYNKSKDSTFPKLRLDSLVEFSSNMVRKPPFVFNYNTSMPLPPNNSIQVDHWGYGDNAAGFSEIANLLDGTSNTFLVSNLLDYAIKDSSFTTYYNNPIPYQLYNPYPYSYAVHQLDRTPKLAPAQAGALTSIVYPTGGSVNFAYSLNDYGWVEDSMRAVKVNQAGGLRINKITTYDGISHANDVVRRYSYRTPSDTGRSSGVLIHLPTEQYVIYSSPVPRNAYTTTTFGVLGGSDGGFIGYKYVTESLDSAYTHGYSIYEYTAADSFPDIGSIVANSAPRLSKADYRGLLKSKAVYNNKGVEQYEVRNTYSFDTSNLYYGKVKGLFLKPLTEQIPNSNPLLITDFAITPYYAKNVWVHLKSSTEKTFSQVNPAVALTKRSYYQYDPLTLQPSRTMTIASNGDTVVTKYQYPTINYAAQSTDPLACALDSLNRLHAVSSPYEMVNYLKRGGKTYVTSASLLLYKNFPTLSTRLQTLPTKLLSLKLGNLPDSSTFQFAHLNSAHAFVYDSRYTKDMEVLEYNKYGKLGCAKGLDNVPSSLSWTFSGLYPSALFKNARLSQTLVGNSGSFVGFEGTNTSQSPDIDYWTISCSSQATGNAHTGQSCLQIPIGGTNNIGPNRDFLPDNQNAVYVFSGWFKTANTNCTIVLSAKHNSDTDNSVYPTGAQTSFTIPNTNGQWQYFEAKLDLGKVKSQNSITTPLRLRCVVTNPVSTPLYIDDLEFRPLNTQVNTYAIKPNVGLTTQTDARGITTGFTYDTFNRLSYITDLNGDILKNIVYQYYRK